MNAFDGTLARYGPLALLLFCLLLAAALAAGAAMVRRSRPHARAATVRPGPAEPAVRLPAQRQAAEHRHHA